MDHVGLAALAKPGSGHCPQGLGPGRPHEWRADATCPNCGGARCPARLAQRRGQCALGQPCPLHAAPLTVAAKLALIAVALLVIV